MIRHLFKLVWNRRGANVLILVELLVSFLVLSAVLAVVVYDVDNWRKPLGFDYTDVWCLELGHGGYTMADEALPGAKETIAQMAMTLQDWEEVVAVSPCGINVPFTRNASQYTAYINGVREVVQVSRVSHRMMDILKLDLVAGRWFEPGDGALHWIPSVITRNYADLLFGDEDPIGRELPRHNPDGTLREREEDDPLYRVVGIVSDFRRYSALSTAPLSEFRPISEDIADVRVRPASTLLIRVRPGVTAAFEEKLLRAAHESAPAWTFTAMFLEDARREDLKGRLLPLLFQGIVAGFLIIMVGMGLVGVLWQTVARRTREMGLRRALGASRNAVRGQILGELLALTTLAVVTGTAIFIQLPIMQTFGHVGLQIYLIALALSILVLYPFVILCGLYPSWLATRIHPVQALQYE